jgi:hypothetical protein
MMITRGLAARLLSTVLLTSTAYGVPANAKRTGHVRDPVPAGLPHDRPIPGGHSGLRAGLLRSWELHLGRTPAQQYRPQPRSD